MSHCVREVQVSLRVKADRRRATNSGLRRRASIARIAVEADAGYRVNDASLSINSTNACCACVANVDVVVGVVRYGNWIDEIRAYRRAPVALVPLKCGACNIIDYPYLVDAPDVPVSTIGDNDATFCVDRYAGRITKVRLSR